MTLPPFLRRTGAGGARARCSACCCCRLWRGRPSPRTTICGVLAGAGPRPRRGPGVRGWVQAAHRATQAHADAFEAALETQTGILLTVARLRQLGAAPPDLPERPGRNAAMALGVIPDGSARGVAMAFGVLEPAAGSRPSALREGALEAGLAALAPAGGALMDAHRPAIEAALGRRLRPDALWVTADRGLRYRERVLYRRAQPGRPWLNRMETALAMAPPGTPDPDDPAREHIAGAGAVSAWAAEIGAGVTVGGSAEAAGGASAAGMTAETVEAGDLAAPALAVDADLVVGAATTGRLAAGALTASGQLEAANLRSAGRLDAGSLSAAGTAAIAGPAAAGALAAERLLVAGDWERRRRRPAEYTAGRDDRRPAHGRKLRRLRGRVRRR